MNMIDFLIYTPFVLIALSYIFYFFIGKRIVLNPNVVNVIKRTNYFFFGIGFLLMVMSLFGYYLSSIWSAKIIAWIYLITACFMLVIRRQIGNGIEKTYIDILFYSPMVLIVGWIIPMLGVWICYSFSLFFYTDESTIAFNDKNYMLKFEEGFLVYDYDPTLFKKYGIFQKKMKDIELHEWNFENKFEIIGEGENSVRVKYFTEKKSEIDTLINL